MSKQPDKIEKCPWYETIFRIFFFLGVAGFLYCFLLLHVLGIIMVYDAILFEWEIIERIKYIICEYPKVTLATAVTGYIATLFWVMVETVKYVTK